MRWALFAIVITTLHGTAWADSSCTRDLISSGAEVKAVDHAHIEDAVRARGMLGGVEYQTWGDRPLILGCRLAKALQAAGRLFAARDIKAVRLSSIYSRRRVRKSGRWSRHAYGLPIDIHEFTMSDGSVIDVRNGYEQGLGDNGECVGAPLTAAGRTLKVLVCELRASELFENVLDPDYDAHHYNHFHLDLRPR